MCSHNPVLIAIAIVALCIGRTHAESPGKPAAEPFDVMLHAVEQAFKDVPPADRHLAPRYVLASATYALASEGPGTVGRWRTRLFADATPAADAYRVFQELLRGEWGSLFDLYQLLPGADWRALAYWLNDRAKWMPRPEQCRNGSTALSLLNVCAPQERSYHAHRSLGIVTNAPGGVQKRLMQITLAAAESGKHEEALARMRATLRGAVRYGRLKQTEWCTTLSDITTDADEHADLLDALGDARRHELAASMAQRAAAAHPTDPGVAIAAFDTLLRAGKGKDAFSAMVDAEEAVPYPGRRDVRLHYLVWLYYESRRSSRERTVPEGMMTFQEESEDRVFTAAQPGGVEAQMALGDVHAVARKEKEATTAYRTAWEQATDPVVKWTAWLALAQLDAGEALHHAGAFESLCGEVRDKVPAQRILRAVRAFAERLKKRGGGDEAREAVLRAVVQQYPDLAEAVGDGRAK